MKNYDIQMTVDSDLSLLGNDIRSTDSIRQAIIIRLRWFFREWRYGRQYGVDYFGKVFVKRPNRVLILSMISEQIRSVEGVKQVQNLKLAIDNKTRDAWITFTAITESRERFDMEVAIWQAVDDSVRLKFYVNADGNFAVKTRDEANWGYFVLEDGDLILYSSPRLSSVVEFDLDGDLFATYENNGRVTNG